jgi:hypothetical protein
VCCDNLSSLCYNLIMNNDFLLGYCVALFEGEGSAYVCRRERKGNVSYEPHICIQMTDEEPLLIMQSVMGGLLSGPWTPPKTIKGTIRKPQWSWSVNKKSDVGRIANLLLPFVSIRRKEQLRQVIEVSIYLRKTSR